ncbi:MAG: dihydrofolate reductase family protein [Chloroflexota bacterium]|nr:dihydrofolate reductase family protein [Chloroflexota bacterium]
MVRSIHGHEEGALAELIPFEKLFDSADGEEIPLPPELAALYGPLRLPLRVERPYVLGNFVTSLDGVVALNTPGMPTGGGEIAGPDPHDHALMGLLRSISDAIVVGAGTLAAAPGHLWTAEHVYRPLADAYRSARAQLGKASPPLTVVVTASGAIDLQHAAFSSGKARALVVTTEAGLRTLRQRDLPATVQAIAVGGEKAVQASAVVGAIRAVQPTELILTEGGPTLMASFLAGGCLDELFLTVAPQVAGRDGSVYRPGFVDGKRFAPEAPLWGSLVSARRSGSHLFLRYAFA